MFRVSIRVNLVVRNINYSSESHSKNLTAKVGSAIGAEIKFGSSVAVGLAGLVWPRVVHVWRNFILFLTRNIALCFAIIQLFYDT